MRTKPDVHRKGRGGNAEENEKFRGIFREKAGYQVLVKGEVSEIHKVGHAMAEFDARICGCLVAVGTLKRGHRTGVRGGLRGAGEGVGGWTGCVAGTEVGVPVWTERVWSPFWCAATGSSSSSAFAMLLRDQSKSPFEHSRSYHEWLFVIMG